MERARRDEQDEVRADRAVLRLNGAALDYGQDVPLHAFAGHIVTLVSARTRGDFVYLVEEHDAVLLRPGERLGGDCVLVHHLFRLLVDHEVHRLLDGELPLLLFDAAHDAAEDVAEVDFVAGSVARGELYGLGLLLDFHLDGDAVEMSARISLKSSSLSWASDLSSVAAFLRMGSSMSTRLFSAISVARGITSLNFSSLTMRIETSTRSRIMLSTSLPT